MSRDLVTLALANVCLLAAGRGVLRAAGLGPALGDVPWLGVAYIVGAGAVGVLGSALLVAGLALTWWQLVLLCASLYAAGLLRRGELRQPERIRSEGWVRILPAVTALVLAVLAVDLDRMECPAPRS